MTDKYTCAKCDYTAEDFERARSHIDRTRLTRNITVNSEYYPLVDLALREAAERRKPFDPATSPGMTDMMVSPETLDAFMEANPLPVSDSVELQDKIDGLKADLDSAIEVAWKRGAHEWVRLNYKNKVEALERRWPAPDREAAIEATARREQGPVKVKPLEWERAWMEAVAHTPIGTYSITYRRDGTFDLEMPDKSKRWNASWGSATTSAQADYEARIRAALVEGGQP